MIITEKGRRDVLEWPAPHSAPVRTAGAPRSQREPCALHCLSIYRGPPSITVPASGPTLLPNLLK